MISLNKKVNKVLLQITKLAKGNDVETHLSNYFLNLINKQLNLPESRDISRKLHISQATLSRYIKKLGLSNLKEMAFIINNISFDHEIASKTSLNKIIKQSAKEIKKANKIFFWGVSDCYFILEDFNLKLQRLGINTVLNNYVKNQVSLSLLANKNDIIFIVSFSGKHRQFQKAISNTKAKTIVITQSLNSSIAKKANIVLPVKQGKKLNSIRIVTREERIEALEYIDFIIFELLKDDKLKQKNLKCIN